MGQLHILTSLISATFLGLAISQPDPGGSTNNTVAVVSQATSKPTFHRDIERIIQDKCVSCHREGGIGPFSLTTYDQVKSKSSMIKAVLTQGIMPPWFAEKAKTGPTPWMNDLSISNADKKAVFDWIASGSPEGDKSSAPKPKSFDPHWELGKPDLVVKMANPVYVKAEGYMPYQFGFGEHVFEKDTWIQAVQVKPTSLRVVHHVLVFVVPNAKSETSRQKWERRSAEGTSGFFAAYVPGNGTVIYPSGFAKRIPKGSQLEFQIHYTPNGKAVTDQTEVGLVFCTKPPLHEVKTTGLANVGLAIPPGSENHPEVAALKVPFDAQIMSFMPHMHLRGKAAKYEILSQSGKSETLINIPKYDFNWQLRYAYKEPKAVKKGDTLKFTGWFDNSSKNPYNPDPKRTVPWGEQTYDEMLIGYVEYFVPGVKPDGGSSLESASNEATERSAIEAMFKRLDKNQDGKLTKAELGQPLLFEKLDLNKDGFVTIDEAVKAIKTLGG